MTSLICEPIGGWATRFTEPIVRLLEQLASVIEGLSDAEYIRRPVGAVDGSVGGHVRHCLDHVRAVLGAAASGLLDYDRRERGTAVEASRSAALEEIRRLSGGLTALPPGADRRTVQLRVLMSADGEPLEVATTLGRELAYTLSHTVHHNALIAAMVRTLGRRPPDRFGYAPATTRHLEAQACAR